jgi:predicted transcriptional regulator of viral defense system
MRQPELAKLLKLAHLHSSISAKDATRVGVHSQVLSRLIVAGVLERMARGQYRLAERPIGEHHGLVLVARAAPSGVVCLLSALNFHGIGTQLPAEVWIALERGVRAPSTLKLPARFVHLSGAAFHEGIATHIVDGGPIRVYTVAKTLADVFKFRNTIGLDVAIEALRDAWQHRSFTMDALGRAARACRVERVMRPYIEAVVA